MHNLINVVMIVLLPIMFLGTAACLPLDADVNYGYKYPIPNRFLGDGHRDRGNHNLRFKFQNLFPARLLLNPFGSKQIDSLAHPEPNTGYNYDRETYAPENAYHENFIDNTNKYINNGDGNYIITGSMELPFETTTDFPNTATIDYETTTLEEDLFNRMGVSGAVVATLLG